MSTKPTNFMQATGFNQVMQEINPKDSKSVHLGIAADYEAGLKQRSDQPKDLTEGIRKACTAIRSAYGQASTQP